MKTLQLTIAALLLIASLCHGQDITVRVNLRDQGNFFQWEISRNNDGIITGIVKRSLLDKSILDEYKVSFDGQAILTENVDGKYFSVHRRILYHDNMVSVESVVRSPAYKEPKTSRKELRVADGQIITTLNGKPFEIYSLTEKWSKDAAGKFRARRVGNTIVFDKRSKMVISNTNGKLTLTQMPEPEIAPGDIYTLSGKYETPNLQVAMINLAILPWALEFLLYL